MPGITDPAEAYFKDGAWGWDGTQWRKLTLVWGFSEPYAQAIYRPDVDAGDEVMTFTGVSSGEIWIVTHMAAYSGQINASRVEMTVATGGIVIAAKRAPYTVANMTIDWDGFMVLEYPDSCQIVFRDVAAGDDCWGQVAGYKMKITE